MNVTVEKLDRYEMLQAKKMKMGSWRKKQKKCETGVGNYHEKQEMEKMVCKEVRQVK